VHHEPGWLRRPANAHDLRIWALEPGAALLPPRPRAPPAARADVPGVPGAFVLSGVLSHAECAALRRQAEAMGFCRDEPLGGPEAGGAQEAIDNCHWLVDDRIMAAVWARCQPLLPAQLPGGERLAGINARWRLFRYSPGAVYRPHIDGAWPGSGLDADGRYVYDAHRDGRRSRLTFLLYLNGEGGEAFEGGATVFYTAGGEEAAMEARGVAPREGAVLVFPHGDHPGALVHEGSAVRAGVKYVARTEVLYMPPSGS